MINKLKAFSRASGVYLKELVRPEQPVQRHTDNGQVVLRGWSHSPEESLIEEAARVEKVRSLGQRYVLFGLEGPHAGEKLSLSKVCETLGSGVENSVVVTPGEEASALRYQVFVNGQCRVQAPPGEVFTLNGKQEQQATLLEFDELELLGNRFLFLDANVEPLKARRVRR